MKTCRIGRTGVEVTELGFGAAPIGNLYERLTDEQAAATVGAAWDAGVRYFDTAPHYGLGLSERRLGAALANHPRDHYVLSTKVGRLLVRNASPCGSDLAAGFAVPDAFTRVRDYTADGVRRSLDASLNRLSTDHVDIALVHDPESHMDDALRAAVPALVELRDQGVIRAVGVGMNFWRPLARFVDETDVDVVMLAGRWTLLDRSGEPLLDRCGERGVAVLAAAPFNSGLLAHPWPPDGAPFNYREAPPNVLQRARVLARICDQQGISLPHAAIRFALRHPAVAAVVAGTGTVEQAESAAAWAGRELPDEIWMLLDAASAATASVAGLEAEGLRHD